jgi:hypothetical protein
VSVGVDSATAPGDALAVLGGVACVVAQAIIPTLSSSKANGARRAFQRRMDADMVGQ